MENIQIIKWQSLTAIIIALISFFGLITPKIIDLLSEDNFKGVGELSREEIKAIANAVITKNPNLRGEQGEIGKTGLQGPTGSKGESGVARWIVVDPSSNSAFDRSCDYKIQFPNGDKNRNYKGDFFYATYVSKDLLQHNFFVSGDKNGAIKVFADNKGISQGSLGGQVSLFKRCES